MELTKRAILAIFINCIHRLFTITTFYLHINLFSLTISDILTLNRAVRALIDVLVYKNQVCYQL